MQDDRGGVPAERTSCSKRGRAMAAVLLGLSCVTSLTVLAQTLPNAGSELQQLQRERPKSLPPQGRATFEPPPPLTSVGGATVTVHQFVFAGNQLLPQRRLARAVAGFLNRPLDFNQLQNAAIAVAQAYRNAGWVVRAYLPQQDVTNGTVTIQVIEATLGKVEVRTRGKRVSAARLERMVDAAQAPGKPLNADALDRALLLMSDLPGVSANGRLNEGSGQGETDLLVQETDQHLVSGYVSADNGGERFTGAARVIEQLSLNSLFGIGDRTDTLLLHTQGSDFQSLGFSLPMGYAGWRVGLNASHLTYRIVSADFASLDSHGNSTTGDLNVSYPIIRARMENLYFSLDLANKRFANYSNGASTSHYDVNAASASLYGNLFDSFGGGGESTASLTFEQGLLDLAGSPNEAADALTAQTAGSFQKVSVSLSRLQTLTPHLGLFASISGQLADKNLDSSEKIYLGGANGVRAYPANEAGGTDGAMLNLELRGRLPANFTVTGFFDWGAVLVNKFDAFAQAPRPNTEQLKGAGLSVGWVAPFGLSLRATISHRIGSNPDPTITGTDQDGSRVMNRVWVQATMPF
jgi:hemolysin activation/secretion protein